MFTSAAKVMVTHLGVGGIEDEEATGRVGEKGIGTQSVLGGTL